MDDATFDAVIISAFIEDGVAVIEGGLREPAYLVNSSLSCQSRAARAGSLEDSLEGTGSFLTKYLPVTDSTSGEDAR